MGQDEDKSRESESELMIRLARGDEAAMQTMIERFGPGLHRLVDRLTGWNGDSDDVLQEVLVAAWNRAHTFRGTGSLEGWLRRLAVNRCRNWRRSQQAFRRVLETFARRRQVLEVAAGTEPVDKIQWALQRLKPTDRTVLVLFYLEELEGDEVAEALGIKIATLHMRLTRARHRLKEILESESTSDESRQTRTASEVQAD